MTTKEKAKAYEMALEAARKVLGVDRKEWEVVQRVLHNIFPELREGEDERMMREFNDWLSEEIECRTNDLRDEKDRRTLNMLCYISTKNKDWLEKQKDVASERVSGYSASISSEQKPDNLDESEKIAAAYQLGRSDERKQKEQKPAEWNDYKDKVNIPYCSSDEQKSVEKQDYSGLNDFERAIHRGFICAGVKNVPVTIIKETAQDCLAQIPDEISYGEYLQYGERQYARGYKDGADSVKPVEWSEEDEKMMRGICTILSGLKDIVGEEAGKILNEKCYWLKSLRPSWKPSEEQMEALHTAVYLKEMEFYGGLKDKLRELYDDLLKLK